MRLPCLENSRKISYHLIQFYYTMVTGADHTPPSTYNTGTEYCHSTCCPSWGFLLLQKGILTVLVKTGWSVLQEIICAPHLRLKKHTWDKICQNPILCHVFKDVFPVTKRFQPHMISLKLRSKAFHQFLTKSSAHTENCQIFRCK